MIPCPRRSESALRLTEPSSDKFDPCCSYCGSMNPDTFMRRLEEGTLTLGSTDKSYKVYVRARKGSEPLHQNEIKFYFQHLSEAQQTKFVELYNNDLQEKRLFQFQGGYSFYVAPFFMRFKKDSDGQTSS